MSTTDNPNLFIDTKISYTFDEAIYHMKNRNRYPTTTTIIWKDARTGKRVHIGNSSM